VKSKTNLSGKLQLDDSWEPAIYLSHILKFDQRFEISNQMIIAETALDSLGKFKLTLDFLPSTSQLYRVHIVKKGDSPASLIIGGKNENYTFLVLNNHSQISLKNDTTLPPFSSVRFAGNSENQSFTEFVNLHQSSELKASLSNASVRKLINDQLLASFLTIADSSLYQLIFISSCLLVWEAY